jgi:chemotaxis protein methyltransferase CheR
MQEYTAQLLRSGAKEQLSPDYYLGPLRLRALPQSLRRNVVFAHHNLVTDGSFNEFNVILCRNVMIYFDEQLQARVHRLFYESLRRFGILALGRKESLRGTAARARLRGARRGREDLSPEGRDDRGRRACGWW